MVSDRIQGKSSCRTGRAGRIRLTMARLPAKALRAKIRIPAPCRASRSARNTLAAKPVGKGSQSMWYRVRRPWTGLRAALHLWLFSPGRCFRAWSISPERGMADGPLAGLVVSPHSQFRDSAGHAKATIEEPDGAAYRRVASLIHDRANRGPESGGLVQARKDGRLQGAGTALVAARQAAGTKRFSVAEPGNSPLHRLDPRRDVPVRRGYRIRTTRRPKKCGISPPCC